MNPTRQAIESGITIVDQIVESTNLDRARVIFDCRRLERKGLGKLIVGRKGHPSRFERFLDTAPKKTNPPPPMPEILTELVKSKPWAFLTRKLTKEDAALALDALMAKYS